MKLLIPIILALFLSCSTSKVGVNIVDGKITSNSVTLKTEDIISDCKKECKDYIVSTDGWCDCMYNCSDEVFIKNKVSIGNMKMRVYINECSSKSK